MAQQKVEHDFQTMDWCRSQHAVAQGEQMLLVLRQMMAKRGKTSATDVLGWIGKTRRTAQRYLDQLERAGYVIRDDATPSGFTPTDKTKQIFTIKLVNKNDE
ncbi:hypothetical protein [Acinetobacter sp. CFCC 11171]|uniref:hypothetical protein n=1 Tax=Acinetobacter sp. CFCC 11171 TaxID=1775558 RepID=UPI000DCFB812|nr:hypothetical protein [Acinetobacter sp. CFCC 11171]